MISHHAGVKKITCAFTPAIETDKGNKVDPCLGLALPPAILGPTTEQTRDL